MLASDLCHHVASLGHNELKLLDHDWRTWPTYMTAFSDEYLVNMTTLSFKGKAES